MNVGKVLRETAARIPGKTAVIFRDEKITYADLEMMATRLANRLRGSHVARGDRVAILLVSRKTRKFCEISGKGRLFRGTYDPDDVSVGEVVRIFDPHPGPGIHGVEKAFPDIFMHHIGQVPGCRPLLHQEGIGQDPAPAVRLDQCRERRLHHPRQRNR